MATLKTAEDVGNIIRQRRKALGWDQARLASESGVSRQWVVDIEKGKPRAELQLVLRVMNVLGLRLAAADQQTEPARFAIPAAGLDDILDRHRAVPAASPRTDPYRLPLSYAQILERARAATGHQGTAEPPSVHETPPSYTGKHRKPK
ncbi:helix-turn-helix transcriptional regulator [Stenotrophomonas sp. ISL-67]|uniref:helix-turn-helix transcriptional regulator n=1 Tax=Stenotrophomonas sp. ISL-67 TaxID=2819171 RepID=UPI001BEA986E|nr:helix-turn-helix transcriptional regulator [Stenotrophomonas sp. ISL-67]MBT2767202.1 helix-turn-helix transcriptional regulator [Stenotrophomonas sp. ISL-67]